MAIIGGRELLFVRYIFARILVSETIKHWIIRWIWSGLSAEICERWILSWRWRRSWIVTITSPIPGLVVVWLVWWICSVVIIPIIVVVWVVPSFERLVLSEVVRILITWPEISPSKWSWGCHHRPITVVPTSPIPKSVGRSTSLVVILGERNLFLCCGFILQLLDFFIPHLLPALIRSVSIGSTIPTKPCSFQSSLLIRVNRSQVSL